MREGCDDSEYQLQWPGNLWGYGSVVCRKHFTHAYTHEYNVLHVCVWVRFVCVCVMTASLWVLNLANSRDTV
jgi:hypothetical protein